MSGKVGRPAEEQIRRDEVPHATFRLGEYSRASPMALEGQALFSERSQRPVWKAVGGIACCGSSTDRGQTARSQHIQMEHAVRVFILYANPVVASFGATLRKQVVTTLRSGGHEMDVATSTPNPLIRSWVSRSGCEP